MPSPLPWQLPAQVALATPVPVLAQVPWRGWLPAESGVHVPGAVDRSQASQVPEQARLQQVPSAQVVPLMHPPATSVHFCPRLALHSPALSQVPAHLPGSSAFFTEMHDPLLQV